MTNAATANAIIAYARAADGTLTPNGTYPTGGKGTGMPRLGSQGSVVLTEDHRWLLVTNPGSDDLSVFAVRSDGTLQLTDREPSNGDRPESVTVHDGLVFVLNTGTPNNISGFTLDRRGRLTPLPGTRRSLSQEGALPAEVQFSPDGNTLVVTERNTSLIDTFRISHAGRPSGVMSHQSSGVGPFGFAFRRDGVFVVTESFDGAPGQAAASSYSLEGHHRFELISGTVRDTQSDVCWTVITKDGNYAYVTNNGSGTISSYTIDEDGKITLLEPVAAVTGGSGGFGTRDAALDGSGAFLYAIDVGTLTMNAFRVHADGSLTTVAVYGGLPPTVAGTAAF
ncbi:MAG: lactonase family protein [Acidobacteria bacterium]|nr:lactonase family protein [Acidobacteriota bacterium]